MNGKDDKIKWLSMFFDPLSSDLHGFKHVILVYIGQTWHDTHEMRITGKKVFLVEVQHLKKKYMAA